MARNRPVWWSFQQIACDDEYTIYLIEMFVLSVHCTSKYLYPNANPYNYSRKTSFPKSKINWNYFFTHLLSSLLSLSSSAVAPSGRLPLLYIHSYTSRNWLFLLFKNDTHLVLLVDVFHVLWFRNLIEKYRTLIFSAHLVFCLRVCGPTVPVFLRDGQS